MLTQCLRATVVVAATAAAIVGASTPTGIAIASSPTHPALPQVRHAQALRVRGFDSALLGHSNRARAAHDAGRYAMNRKLWAVAHHWAEHLAHAGVLEHNPQLTKELSVQCPRWTAIGENVGVVNEAGEGDLFAAYMASPEHRANILDRRYRQVGIASVKVTTASGQVQEWDVMDFGNHC
jgi:uncharacterized protein YkwD